MCKFHSLGYHSSGVRNLSFCQNNSSDLTWYSSHCEIIPLHDYAKKKVNLKLYDQMSTAIHGVLNEH